MKTTLILCVFAFALAACSNQPCKIEERADAKITGDEKVSSAKKDLTNRVFVYKADGSQQCGMGTKTDVNEMKKELAGIEVFSAENKHDGMMRTQVCGQATGYNNVYEINVKDLEAATKLGFKKWLR